VRQHEEKPVTKLQTALKILFENCPKAKSKATKTPIEKISNGGGEHYTLEKLLLKKVPIRYGNLRLLLL
jgi:hypothetical protein